MRALKLLFAAAVTGAVLSFATVAYPATQTFRSPESWTQFRLENSNNAVLPGTLEVSWRISGLGPFSSSPALAGGVLYIGDNEGGLYAIDPLTGKILWRQHLTNPIMTAPIVYKTLVIVGEGDENSPQGSSPSHPVRVGAPPSSLAAFDRRTGALRWRVSLEGSGMPTPAIISGVLVHHNGAGDVLGVRPETGEVLYRRNLRSIASMAAALPIDGGRFVTTGVQSNAVWLLEAKNAAIIWRALFSPLASGIGDCPPASDGERIYCNYVMPPVSGTQVQTERQAVTRAYAIDLRTGKRVWDVKVDKGILPVRNEAAIPLLSNGTLYFGSSVQWHMHAVDPRTGALKWVQTSHGAIKGGIVEVDGVLYYGDLGGYLWALDARNGRVIGVKNMHTRFNVGSPIVVGRTLVIGSRGGTLFAIPLNHIRSSRDR